jgi:hypothetical protein
MRIRSLSASALSVAAVVVLSGCQTTQYYWRHNQLSGPQAQQQYGIDHGTCTGAAYRAVGAPPPGPPPDTVTNFSGYTGSGGYFSGQARTSPQSPFFGAPAGAIQAEREIQYRNAYLSVYGGCMAQRGWSLQTVTR